MASMNGISPASTGRHRSAASAPAVVHRPRLDAPAADALPASAPLLVPSLCQIRIPGVSPRIAPPLLSSSSRPPALSAGCSASQGGATSEYQTGPFLCSEITHDRFTPIADTLMRVSQAIDPFFLHVVCVVPELSTWRTDSPGCARDGST